jgi:hypothetical protein
MTLALCAGFLTATVLFYAWSYGAFRNTNQNLNDDVWGEAKASASSIVVTGLFTATSALAIAAAVEVDTAIADLNAVTIGVIALCAALLWFLPRRLLSRNAGANQDGPSPDGTILTLRTGTPGTKPGKVKPAKTRKAA